VKGFAGQAQLRGLVAFHRVSFRAFSGMAPRRGAGNGSAIGLLS
jgi:hypothetical protein